MLFRSRQQPDLMTRVRTALWPRVSWSRSAQYFRKRVLRLSGSPHAIALGVAIGVAVSFTPFLGFHILIALPIAYLLGGNLVASALGTAFFNPLTAPFIVTASFRVGHFLIGGPVRFRHGGDAPDNILEKLLHGFLPVLKQTMAGALPLGIVAGVIVYVIVAMGTSGFQTVRRERLATRRRQKEDQAVPPTRPTMESV
jgi:uncharacterized protein (DUF2062 family)